MADHPFGSADEAIAALDAIHTHTTHMLATQPHATLPSSTSLEAAHSSLLKSLPARGHGLSATTQHLLSLAPSFNNPSLSPHYYGFVTGGVTPAARAAEVLAAAHDQNVQVHLPEQTSATLIEHRALLLLCEALHLDRATWAARTLTTGATGANILGLTVGRDAVLDRRLRTRNETRGASELGILEAARVAGVSTLQVLTTRGHSGLYKAAQIAGIGSGSVEDVGDAKDPFGVRFDFARLEACLARQGAASIVVVSCGEVNTGRFATRSVDEMQRLRALCDTYAAWLHVDGAFGLFARCLLSDAALAVEKDGAASRHQLTMHTTDTNSTNDAANTDSTNDAIDEEFAAVAAGTLGIALADSIASDAHKMLNTPYDCGIFLACDLEAVKRVCRNPNAAYLSPSSPLTSQPTPPPNSSSMAQGKQDQDTDLLNTVESPLNTTLENSRRFRALPVYATLHAYGSLGLKGMLQNQVRLTRKIGEWIAARPELELLNGGAGDMFVIALFRARDEVLNRSLVKLINASRRVYVSGTVWGGKPAARVAVATWQADPERDVGVFAEVVGGALRGWSETHDVGGGSGR